MNNADIVNTLNRLIETCKDGEYGFRSSARHMRDEELRRLLDGRAADCRLAASELQQLVAELGGNPEDHGSAGEAVHRGWVAVKGTLAGYSDHKLLAECERGEDSAIERYRAAMNETLPDSVRGVVARQFQGVKRNHAQVRELRDRVTEG